MTRTHFYTTFTPTPKIKNLTDGNIKTYYSEHFVIHLNVGMKNLNHDRLRIVRKKSTNAT